MMREKFQQQLKDIRDQIRLTSSMCLSSLERASALLFSYSPDDVEEVLSGRRKIDKEIETTEDYCIQILYRQQPVAQDLIFLSNVLKLIIDLRRISAQTVETVILADQLKSKLNGFKEDLVVLTERCLRMFRLAVENADSTDPKTADQIIRMDNDLDQAYLSIKKKIKSYIMKETETEIDPVDILLIAKYFERIGDHIVNIAQYEKVLT